jgi:hypothetical protein
MQLLILPRREMSSEDDVTNCPGGIGEPRGLQGPRTSNISPAVPITHNGDHVHARGDWGRSYAISPDIDQYLQANSLRDDV